MLLRNGARSLSNGRSRRNLMTSRYLVSMWVLVLAFIQVFLVTKTAVENLPKGHAGEGSTGRSQQDPGRHQQTVSSYGPEGPHTKGTLLEMGSLFQAQGDISTLEWPLILDTLKIKQVAISQTWVKLYAEQFSNLLDPKTFKWRTWIKLRIPTTRWQLWGPSSPSEAIKSMYSIVPHR